MAQPIDIVACLVGPFEFVVEVCSHICRAIDLSQGVADLVGDGDTLLEEVNRGEP